MNNKRTAIVLSLIVMLLGGVSILGISTANRLAEAQLIDIDVDGPRRIIGHEPQGLGERVYRVRTRWAPLSLAVYLDGKRLLRNVDYVVDPRYRLITFVSKTDEDSVVIIDYTPR